MKYFISLLMLSLSITFYAQKKESIYKNISVFSTKNDSLQINDIIHKYEKGEFTKEVNPKIYKKLGDKTWWYHLKLTKNNKKQFLILAHTYLSYGKVYLKNNAKIKPLQQISYYENQSFKYIFYRYPTWKIPINLTSNTDVFIKLKNNGGRTRLKFYLETENDFLKRVENEYLIFGLFIAFLICMTLILVFFAVLKKEYVVLFYAGYIFFTIIEFLAGKGLGIQYLWSENLFLTNSSRSFSQTLGTILMGLFYLNFYTFSAQQKWNKNIFKWGVLIIIPFVFLYIYKIFFGGLSSMYLFLWISLRIVILFWFFNHIYLVIKKQIPFYLVIAFVLPILAISTHQSINPSVYISKFNLLVISNIYYITLIIEILLFTRYIFNSVIKSQQKYVKLKKVSDELKYNFQNKTLEIQQQERNKLVGNVHDSFGGYLEALKLRLTKKEGNTPKKIQEILDSFYKDYRYLLNSLYTPKINALNFTENLIEFCDKLNELTNNIISHDFSLSDKTLSQEKCVHLYRIISELVTNAIKYANASLININILQKNTNQIILQIKDNGIGFDKNNIRKNALGLKNIKNRVKLLNGKIEINSIKNKGTNIVINFINENNTTN